VWSTALESLQVTTGKQEPLRLTSKSTHLYRHWLKSTSLYYNINNARLSKNGNTENRYGKNVYRLEAQQTASRH